VVGIAVVVGALAFASWRLPLVDGFVRTAEWVRGAGPLGVVVYALVFVVWSVLGLPASMVQGGAAWLWGPLGVPFAWIVSTASAWLAFLIARSGLADLVRARFGGSTLVRAVDLASAEHGVRLVVLLRLSPLAPFNVVSYVSGLTRVRVGQAVGGTLIGSIVPVALYGVLGSTARDLEELLAGRAAEGNLWFTLTALGLTLIVTVGVSMTARRAMQQVLAADRA
jgi:uncharacterized membrane protein YdjX (TVP38/TMEM64 family)